MYKYLLINFIIVSQSTFAQFDLQKVIDESSIGITKIITLDINNDGLKDIATAHGQFQQNRLSYYLNQGNGTFTTRLELDSNIEQPQSLAAGDFNNDGWQDIVSFSNGFHGSELFLYSNQEGNYPTRVSIDSISESYANVLVSDVDNDGDEDLIVISDVELMIFTNNGNTNFTKTVVEPGVSTENYTLALADIDGNGFVDIVIGGVKTLIYSNTGDIFNFDSTKTDFINNQFFNGLVFLVNLNDFDNDGDVDLLIGGSNQTDFRWHTNDGNGFFTIAQIFETNILQCKSIASKDLDNDGDVDILTSFPQTGQVVWYMNDGKGNFSNLKLIHQEVSPFFTNIVSTEDLTNNGSNDVLWSEELSIQLSNDNIFRGGFE